MLDRFRLHLETTKIIPPGAQVILGYSGGADSTCLLHLLNLSGINVVAAHLHHGQRPEAEKEMGLCRAHCEQLGIPIMVGRADVPRIARDLKISLEEAGRKARYDFFRQVAANFEFSVIATAHTMDDRVETVLFNLCRGTGLRGLRGIPAQNGNVVRPILFLTRAETRAFCEASDLWFHDDPANFDVSHSRTRLRLNVLPEFLKINPNALESIAEMAEMLGSEDDLLDSAAARLLEQAEVRTGNSLEFLLDSIQAQFDSSLLSHAPIALRRRAVRLAARFMGTEIDRNATFLITDQLGNNSGSWTGEGGTVTISWTPEKLVLRDLVTPTVFRQPLTYPGETDSQEFGWRIQAIFDESAPQFERDALEVWVDPQCLREPLHFRSLSPGDRIQPMGFNGTRKVASLMSDLKLDEAIRLRLPIICDMIGPVWIPGVCLADRVKPPASGARSLRLTFGPSSSK